MTTSPQKNQYMDGTGTPLVVGDSVLLIDDTEVVICGFVEAGRFVYVGTNKEGASVFMTHPCNCVCLSKAVYK